ncbi:MAG: hypothetical protein A3K53_01915 [Deltaproteobacteria bacterium RIFOXYB2_FULL_66_7]|nr:MAG: hypothetical protein A3K53_01915 [Deltaproteobacteria bacterium RIFOXYB2_FULL_66_7]
MKVEAPESRTIRRVDWGIAPHEVGLLADYEVLDAFGRVLPIEVRDEGTQGGKRLFVDLTRPVLPGENAELVVSYADRSVLREGQEWIFRHEGDYPDDRLVSRAVLLPRGAVIRQVSPEPSYRNDEPDRPLVIWRRYFPAGDRSPWEIRFTVG